MHVRSNAYGQHHNPFSCSLFHIDSGYIVSFALIQFSNHWTLSGVIVVLNTSLTYKIFRAAKQSQEPSDI
jgi:hypothetical protein